MHLHFTQSFKSLSNRLLHRWKSSKKKLLDLASPQEEIDLVCVWLSDEIQKALISWHLGCRRRSFHFSRIFLRACCPRNTLLSLIRAKSREVIISERRHASRERKSGGEGRGGVQPIRLAERGWNLNSNTWRVAGWKGRPIYIKFTLL